MFSMIFLSFKINVKIRFEEWQGPYAPKSWRLYQRDNEPPTPTLQVSVVLTSEIHTQWTLQLRQAWHTNNLGYDQNFSFDLRPKSWVTTRMPVKAKTRGCKQRPEMCS